MSHLPTSLRILSLLVVSAGGAGCGGSDDPGIPADTTSMNGAEGPLVGGSGSVTGSYGGEAIGAIKAAYYIGLPLAPEEAAGGPFVNLFSTAVTCNDISVTGWLSTIPPETQVLEVIIGSTTAGSVSPVADAAAANVAEVNYLFGRVSTEVRATTGSVTLTAYAAKASVDGSLNVTFPAGGASGTFHAVYCPGGQEESR